MNRKAGALCGCDPRLSCLKEVRLKRGKWETTWNLMARMTESAGPRRIEFLLPGNLIGVSRLVETIRGEFS